MTIRWVYGVLPALVFYVASLPKPWQAGCANGPIVRIRGGYQSDDGLLEHELTHVRQWYRTFGLASLLYLLSRTYRLRAEVEAYRVQANFYPDDRRPLFASFIAQHYNLSIGATDAETLLSPTKRTTLENK